MTKPIDGDKVLKWMMPKGFRPAKATAHDKFRMKFVLAMGEGLFDLDTEEDKD